MTIITLTSDWGTRDHYLAMVKGNILSKIPGVTIVDISHNIPPFNLNSASFVLRNIIPAFPEGTIHIMDITSDATIEMPHCVALYEGQFFIGADNGIFSLIFDHPPDELVEIDMIQESDSFTFSANDIFIKVAKHIIDGNPVTSVGPARKLLTSRIRLNAVTEPDLIKGHVIYVDRYENVFTNISKDLFLKIGKKRPFKLTFGASRYQVQKISESYKDVSEGEILALFSATGYLEIGISMGNAAGLLGLKVDDSVRVEFG